MTWKTLPYRYNAFKVKQYANYALHSVDIMHVDEDSIRMIDFDAETTTVVRKRDLQHTFIFDIYIYKLSYLRMFNQTIIIVSNIIKMSNRVRARDVLYII